MFSSQARIPAENLLLALEPETASIFWYLPIEKLHGAKEEFAMTAEGTRYMIADLGGILIFLFAYVVRGIAIILHSSQPLSITSLQRNHIPLEPLKSYK